MGGVFRAITAGAAAKLARDVRAVEERDKAERHAERSSGMTFSFIAQ
jgi:hypothetical protein